MKRAIALVALAALVLAGLACGSEKTVLSPTMPTTTEVEATEAPVSEAPTEAPEPTETPKPVMAAEVLSVGWYEDSIGSLWFVGELENTGDVDLASVEVIVSLKSGDGTLAAVDSSYAGLDVVYPGEVAPFSVLFFLETPTEWADYEINIQTEAASSFDYATSYRDLEIVDSSGKAGEFAAYQIVGQIQNTGEQDAEFVEITVTLYDAGGNVVGVDSSYTEFDIVKVEQVSPFDIQVLSVAGDVDHYTLIAEGQPAD